MPHELNEDELIKNLVPDPSQVPDARMLTGFLGRSPREGFWRLYTTAELNEYVEFAGGDLLHAQSLATPENPLGGTAVWIKREANIFQTRATSREAQAEFLQGSIASRAGGARAGGFEAFRFGLDLRAKDPTLFRENTCALSACISKYAVCTNSGQNTCTPALCF